MSLIIQSLTSLIVIYQYIYIVATLPNLVSLIADHNNVKDFKAFNV